MKITIGSATREVTLHVKGHVVYGKVGKAYYQWNPNEYELPFVRIFHRKLDETSYIHARYYVKAFLLAYKEKLAPVHSPIHLKEREEDVDCLTPALASPLVSGVSKWMKDNHKVWTECHMKNGTIYMRRTRFKQESIDIVEKYLPHCSRCQIRENCNKPCINPAETSAIEYIS